MFLKAFPLLACVVLCGCTTFDMVPVETEINENASSVSPEVVAALPPGAVVEVTFHSHSQVRKFEGTVLHASPDGVALLNCKISHRVELNHGKKTQEFNQRAPVQWISARRMTSTRVISQPPPDYVAPQLDIDTNDHPL